MSSLDRITNLLVLVLLIEMMLSAGLRVSWSDLAGVFRNASLLARAAVANYIVVPAVVILLLHLFPAKPLVAIGFLLVGVCPAAPFAPAPTAIARGNVPVSVGLMVILAGSSAFLAPLLLSFSLPLVAHGADLKIDTSKIVTTLLMTQILPLGIGIIVHSKRPRNAERLRKPSNVLGALLSLAVVALIVTGQSRTLTEIRGSAFVGINLLLLVCLAGGWILGGKESGIRNSVGLTTAARNVGVALVIATASFPDTAAVTAVMLVAIFQTVLLLLFAVWMGRFLLPWRPS